MGYPERQNARNLKDQDVLGDEQVEDNKHEKRAEKCLFLHSVWVLFLLNVYG